MGRRPSRKTEVNERYGLGSARGSDDACTQALRSWSADRRPLRLVETAEPEVVAPTLDQVMRLMGAVAPRYLAMVNNGSPAFAGDSSGRAGQI